MPTLDASREAARRDANVPGPEEFPGLRMIRLLARGGFAEVWEAEQVSLDRRVAVKILRHEHLEQEEMVRLFEQEARVLARLNHPNVVQVIDKGNSPRGPYFVMEFIEGDTLQVLLSRGKLGRERALAILLQAARGLAYAHRNRVIHRDVKPANILVSRRGQVKLSDFGIAAVRRAAGEADDTGPETRTALGTRAFMAPEQRTSFDEVGPEADVYSMGVILHRILAGKLPPAPGRIAPDAGIPDNLRPILERALSPSPSRRYQDAGAFREALVNALEGRHIDDRVRRGAASALGASGRFELLDVIRQDDRRSVYLVRKGGPSGERIVVKRYVKDAEALRTVRQLIRLEHPNIVRIFAVGEREDSFIMLMEHLPGGDLRERLVKAHPWREVVKVGKQVALALAYAARHDIVHGNLRPSNVLFDAEGKVRVTDFGLPEHYRGEPKRNWYAAPEGRRSHAGDLYALGAILYEMLFAAPIPESGDPFRGVPLEDVPPGLVEILRRLLAPVDRRYHSAEHVTRDLDQVLEEEGDRLRRERLARQAEEAAARVATTEKPGRSGGRGGSLLPGLLGLGGLVLAWLFQQEFFRNLLVDLLARL